MSAAKTMFLHLLDGGSTMQQGVSRSKGALAKFSLAKSLISTFSLQRMLASKTVECGLLCANGDDSFNECVELRRPSMSTLRVMQELERVGDENANVAGGLSEAVEILMTTNEGKKFNRVMVLYTDGETPLLSEDEMKDVERSIKENDILFYAILLCDEHCDGQNSNINENIAKFRKFVENVGGLMATVNDLQGGLKFLSSGPGLGSRPMQSKILFEISPSLKLSCVFCTKTMKAPLPSLKKQSNLSYDEDVPDSGKVSTNYIYRNPSDPDEELEFEDRVKGYRYGPQYIPMAGMDENLLKITSEPVLRLLGFVSAASVARHHFLASSFIVGVAAGDANDGARRAIAALGEAMQRLKQAALGRLVKRANSDPWLVVLLPMRDGTLLMHRLPCAEDIRNFLFPPLTSMSNVTPLQKKAVEAAMDSMTISSLQPKDLLMANPAMTAFLSKVQENADVIDSYLPGIESYDNTFQSVGDHPSSSKIWGEVTNLFKLEPTDQGSLDKKKRKQYWSDIEIVGSTGADGNRIEVKTEGQESGRKKVKDETHFPVPAAISEGSVNPSDELDKIVSSYAAAQEANANNLDDIVQVMAQSIKTVESIIQQLVENGATGAHYRKAATCLTKLRETYLIDINRASVDQFNSFLVSIKSKFKSGRHAKFWRNIVDGNITLISKEEAGTGGVSPDDAQKFLEEDVIPESIEVPEVKKEEVEEDDMFDDMA